MKRGKIRLKVVCEEKVVKRRRRVGEQGSGR